MKAKSYFVYNEADDDGRISGSKTLPFSCLIIGNFSGTRDIEKHSDVHIIDKTRFNPIFKLLKVNLDIYLNNYLEKDENPLRIQISIESMENFDLNYLLSKIEIIQNYLNFIDKLKDIQVTPLKAKTMKFNNQEKKFLANLNVADVENIKPLDAVLSLSNSIELLRKQINEFIYNADYQQLEFNWKSLHKLIMYKTDQMLLIKILDTRYNLLEEDLDSGLDITETLLFEKVFSNELDQYGGIPISLIVNSFIISRDDGNLMTEFAKLSRMSSCPVISSIEANFFGLDDIPKLENDFDFEDYRKTDEFAKWRKLGLSHDARFLALLIGKTKLREANQSFILRGLEIKDMPNENQLFGVWGSPVYNFIIPLIESYLQDFNCFSAESNKFNIIAKNKVSYAQYDWIEWIPSSFLADKLAKFGIMTFSYADLNQSLKINDFNMFNSNSLLEAKLNNAPIDKKINVKLPQLLFISQITHYLRIIQRQSMAKNNAKQLKKELNGWLKKYVSDSDVPGEALRLRKPLKKASIELVEKKIKGKIFIDFQLSIIPHLRYRGLEYNLEL